MTISRNWREYVAALSGKCLFRFYLPYRNIFVFTCWTDVGNTYTDSYLRNNYQDGVKYNCLNKLKNIPTLDTYLTGYFDRYFFLILNSLNKKVWYIPIKTKKNIIVFFMKNIMEEIDNIIIYKIWKIKFFLLW